jgi:putative DNA primase/helicase
LKAALVAEYPAILRWCIDGCLDWQANGLLRPHCVVEATHEYLNEQDLFSQWVDAECMTGRDQTDTFKALFASWRTFCDAHGEEPGRGNEFAEQLINIPGVHRKPGHRSARSYSGIAVFRPDSADWTDPL